jgi:hypothetical protein
MMWDVGGMDNLRDKKGRLWFGLGDDVVDSNEY